MKYKMTIAIIVVAILLTGGILEQIYISNVFAEFSEKLEDIIATPGEGYDYDEVIKTHEWWSKKHRLLESVLPHTQLNEIEITYGELIGAVQTEDYDSASALLNRINATSKAFAEMFEFKLGNVL